MDEMDLNIIKGIIVRLNALTQTVVTADLMDEYERNLIEARKKVDSGIGGAYLQSAFEDSPDEPTPPEQ